MPEPRKKVGRRTKAPQVRVAPPQDPWLSIRQAASALGIAPQTVHARIADGVLDAMKAAGRTFVSRESVDRALEAMSPQFAAAS